MIGLPSSITWQALVYNAGAQYGVRNLTDRDVDFILWERTAFPVCGLDHTVKQIHEFFQGEIRVQEAQA